MPLGCGIEDERGPQRHLVVHALDEHPRREEAPKEFLPLVAMSRPELGLGL